MTQSDFDKYLDHLTKLARGAWPNERGIRIGTPQGTKHGSAIVVVSKDWQLAGIGSHPRGFAGLEALLVALNDPTKTKFARR